MEKKASIIPNPNLAWSISLTSEILPILFLFVTSFTNWDGIGAEFVGLENYSKLL